MSQSNKKRKIGKPVYPGKVEYLSESKHRGPIADAGMWMNLAEVKEQTADRGDR